MRSAVTAKIFTIIGSVFSAVGLVLLLVTAGLTIARVLLAATITGGLGLVFTAIGLPLLVVGLRRLRRFRQLRDHGQEAWGEVTEIGTDPTVTVNGRSPFVVTASWQDPSGASRLATGETFDLPPALKVGDQVRVYFDAASTSDGIVDVDGSLAAGRAARPADTSSGDGQPPGSDPFGPGSPIQRL